MFNKDKATSTAFASKMRAVETNVHNRLQQHPMLNPNADSLELLKPAFRPKLLTSPSAHNQSKP